eukprot:COSAG06_NODE_794_length_12246_cov_7.203836_14_plen_79_part_00
MPGPSGIVVGGARGTPRAKKTSELCHMPGLFGLSDRADGSLPVPACWHTKGQGAVPGLYDILPTFCARAAVPRAGPGA